eukprot:COSAG03_NODE_5367_length_1267_cov_1.216610_2_plen_131_part_00
MWVEHIGKAGAPCACRNGSSPCASAQTCLWMSVGCSIGCKECDGGDKGTTNPNRVDRCGSGMRATNNDPRSRAINRDVEAFSANDWTRCACGDLSYAPVWFRCVRSVAGAQIQSVESTRSCPRLRPLRSC